MCNFVSCWICIGILFGDHPILHISRIRVNDAVICYVYRASVVDESMRTVYLLRDGHRREANCSEHKISHSDIYHKSHM
jgi:hypothetical protein